MLHLLSTAQKELLLVILDQKVESGEPFSSQQVFDEFSEKETIMRTVSSHIAHDKPNVIVDKFLVSRHKKMVDWGYTISESKGLVFFKIAKNSKAGRFLHDESDVHTFDQEQPQSLHQFPSQEDLDQ